MTTYNVVSPGSMVGGQPEDISVVLANFQALAAVINGNLDNANLAPGAAIVPSKIAGYPALSSVFLRGDGAWAAASTPLPDRLAIEGLIAPSDDANLAVQAGWYYMGPSTLNIPIASQYFHLQVLAMNPNHTRQIAYEYNTDFAWTRRRTGGGWTAWVPQGTAMHLIQEIVLGANGYFDFQSIPQMFRHLRVEINAIGTNGSNGESVLCKVNNLGGATDYFWRGANGNGLGSAAVIASITGGNLFAGVGFGGHVAIQIPYYNFGKRHTLMAHYASRVDTSGTVTSDFGVGDQDVALVNVTGGITGLTFFGAGAVNFRTGSRAALYGIA
jgi:hypothetical protein